MVDPYVWDESFLVDIKQLDDEHVGLFDAVREVEANRNDQAKWDHMVELYNEHFRNEEAMFTTILDNQGALLLVAVPPHEAPGLEARADQHDLLGEVGTIESEIVGGGPVSTILTPPFAVDDESLRKGEDEGVGNALGETGEEVHASMSFPGEGPVEIGQTMLAPALASLAPVVLAVTGTVTVAVGGDLLVAEVTEQVPVEGHLLFGW